MSKIPEWLWKVASLLVLPLLIWGIKLEVGHSLLVAEVARGQETAKAESSDNTEQIRALRGMTDRLDERIKALQEDRTKSDKMQDAINKVSVDLAELKGAINATKQTLEQIKALLRQP